MNPNFHCYACEKRVQERAASNLRKASLCWRLHGTAASALALSPPCAALTKHRAPGKMKKPRCAITPQSDRGQRTALVPEWRNWQTRQVQDLVLAREWRFESSFGHQNFSIPTVSAVVPQTLGWSTLPRGRGHPHRVVEVRDRRRFVGLPKLCPTSPNPGT